MAYLLPQIHKNIPKFYYLLDDMDKMRYDSIRDSQKEGHKPIYSNFTAEIKNLKKFIVRGNSDDWKRGIVCGIYWLPENKGIATNIQQLKIILNRCKSSLNASLTKIGLNVILTRGKATNLVLNTFPFLKDNSSEIRQWTIRKDFSPSPSNLLPIKNMQSNEDDLNPGQIDIFTQSNDDNEFFQLPSNEFYDFDDNQNIKLYQYNNFYEIF